MGWLKEHTIQAANGDRACRSDGIGSPIIVLDAQSRHVLTGALVMFPAQDEAALAALKCYAEHAHDSMLAAWAVELARQWEEVKGGEPYV